MKLFLLIISVLVFNFLFSQTRNKLVFDTSNTVILPYEYILGGKPDIASTNYLTLTITQEEFKIADSIIALTIEEHNKLSEEDWQKIYLKKRKYKRQLVVSKHSAGNKIIWFNFFCNDASDFINWKKEILMVHDGGACYFNLIINLTQKKCFEFRVNGVA